MFPFMQSEQSFALTFPARIYSLEHQNPGPSIVPPLLDTGHPTAQSMISRILSRPSLNLSYPSPPVFQSPLLWVEPNPQAPKDGFGSIEPYRPPMQHKIPPQKGRTLWPCTHKDCHAIFIKRTALEQVSRLKGR